jgi:hypothetical protein
MVVLPVITAADERRKAENRFVPRQRMTVEELMPADGGPAALLARR